MGFYFAMRDANIVAYLTDCRAVPPPRLKKRHLWDFLGGIYHPDVRMPAPGEMPWRGFVSSDPTWVQGILEAAERAQERVNQLVSAADGFLDGNSLRTVLAELRGLLSDYKLFGMTVRSGSDVDKQLDAFALHAAYSSRHHALFLITDTPYWAPEECEYLDPFPALIPLTEMLGKTPGMLFWTGTGAATYAPLRDAERLYAQLQLSFEFGEEALAQILKQHRGQARPKSLLHLSDLHLGTTLAAENQELLLSRLEKVVPMVDRIVITGDLFDEPKREYAIHYRNFDLALRRISRKPPVIVPGNHDQKRLGNLGQDLGQIVDLDWTHLSVDDELQGIFFCFDSSREADWARGKVTMQQKRDVGIAFEAETNRRPGIADYLRVALLHHHPFSFEADAESLLNRTLKVIGVSDELFLCMDDGDGFVDWCARRQIPLILHGHKHVARHVRKSVFVDHGERSTHRQIDAVGCGSSLGAEGKPVSYNVVHWNPDTANWSVAFFADPGDGGGFVSQKVVVRSMA